MGQRATLEMEEGYQLRGALFVFIPSSEQKSAPQRALLLDIGQIDGVMFHQKLDCRPKDQERRNVDREHLKGFHGNLRGLQIRTLPQSFRARWVKHGPDADRRGRGDARDAGAGTVERWRPSEDGGPSAIGRKVL